MTFILSYVPCPLPNHQAGGLNIVGCLRLPLFNIFTNKIHVKPENTQWGDGRAPLNMANVNKMWIYIQITVIMLEILELLKRLLDTWDRNGSTSGPTPWQIYDDDDDLFELLQNFLSRKYSFYTSTSIFISEIGSLFRLLNVGFLLWL